MTYNQGWIFVVVSLSAKLSTMFIARAFITKKPIYRTLCEVDKVATFVTVVRPKLMPCGSSDP